MWLKYFHEALKFKGSKKLKEDHFFTIIFNFYLINYYTLSNATSFKLNQ